MINYFEYYSIPISLFPKMNTIKLKFYAYARKFHPDHNSDQFDAEQMTAINNEAYKCLKNLECRMQHVLEISGAWESSKKQMSSVFLMEVMDLQEGIMDLVDMEKDSARLKKKELEKIIEEFSINLDRECKGFDELIDVNNLLLMQSIEANLLKRRYLSRMRENMES